MYIDFAILGNEKLTIRGECEQYRLNHVMDSVPGRNRFKKEG